MKESIERRTFLVGSAATLTTLTLSACKPKAPSTSQPDAAAEPTPPPHTYGFYAPAEVITLDAVLGRIFPENDPTGAPSFREANVGPYIDSQLQLPDFRGLGRMMHGGMEFLQAVSTRRFGGTFDSRESSVQDEILGQFQTGAVKGLKFPQARWFATFHAFALEGYWGDPSYGGNRDRAVWKWVGINPKCSSVHGSCGG